MNGAVGPARDENQSAGGHHGRGSVRGQGHLRRSGVFDAFGCESGHHTQWDSPSNVSTIEVDGDQGGPWRADGGEAVTGKNPVFVIAKVACYARGRRQPFHPAAGASSSRRGGGGGWIRYVGGERIQVVRGQVGEAGHLAFAAGDDFFELVDADILGRHHTGAVGTVASLAQLRKNNVALRFRRRTRGNLQREFLGQLVFKLR